MLLPALCVFALAAVGLAAPRHQAEDDYIKHLLEEEMREEYGNNLPHRPAREDFGQFHDTDDYEQMAQQSQQPQSSNIEQDNGVAEQFDQNNEQQQNGAIEQFDQNDDQEQNGAIKFDQNNDQQQNGAIEQFDQNNDQEQNGAIEQFDQEQNGAIKFDQNNDQAQNGDLEQFDQNNDQAQNGGIEQFDADSQADGTREQDNGIEQLGGQASGSVSSREQDRIHKEAVDRLFGSPNTDEFRVQEDEHFTDVFGNMPGVPQPTQDYPEEIPVVTKKPSWLHRTWSNTKQKAKQVKDKVKGFFHGLG